MTSVPEIVVPTSRWEAFVRALLDSRNAPRAETLGFLLCRRHQAGAHDRYLIADTWLAVSSDYEQQSIGAVELTSAAHGHLLDRVLRDGLHPVHVHTHPSSGPQHFSGADDTHESAYAAACERLPQRPTLLSIVLDVDGRHPNVRVWDGPGRNRRAVLTTGLPTTLADADDPDDPRLARQAIFGAQAQRRLGELHVALVGCGGVGAVFAELASRLGVRRWTLVDDDVLSVSNLNRMPGASLGAARGHVVKVDHVARLIRTMWGREARIRRVPRRIEDAGAQRAVGAADLIVIATDDHSSRLTAGTLGLRLVRPTLQVATHLQASSDGAAPRALGRVTMPPIGGGWCVACGGVIDVERAARERLDPDSQATLASRGYLPDVAAPAVYWLNAAAASLAVRVVHGLVADLGLEVTDGLDWILDATAGRLLALDHDTIDGCWSCDPAGEVYASARPNSDRPAA